MDLGREGSKGDLALNMTPTTPKGKELSPHERTRIRIQSSYGPRFRNTNLLCTENNRITAKLEEFQKTTADAVENKQWVIHETVENCKEKFSETFLYSW